MKKIIKIWIVLIIILPTILWLSMFVLGLIGLAGYWSYYFPLWGLEEPFFKYSTDTGWYYPTLYGNLITAVIYSIVYWIVILIRKQIIKTRTNH